MWMHFNAHISNENIRIDIDNKNTSEKIITNQTESPWLFEMVIVYVSAANEAWAEEGKKK